MDRECRIHGAKRKAYRVLVESQKERNRYEDLYIGWRVILKRILKK
jgi:hypothetical protein